MNAPIFAVEIGNTTLVLGVFPHGQDTPHQVVMTATATPDFSALSSALPPEAGRWFVSSVHRSALQRLEAWVGAQREADEWQVLDATMVPLVLAVDYPDRVGMDRLMAAVAANRRRRPNHAAIVIDAGTAITVDVVTADGIFQGGAILPGAGIAARALHEFTDQLPLVDVPQDRPAVVGRSTVPAIRSGLYWGAVGAVRETAGHMTAELPTPADIFVTGGDGRWLAEHLTSATWEPSLVLSGIASIVAAQTDRE